MTVARLITYVAAVQEGWVPLAVESPSAGPPRPTDDRAAA